MLQFLGFGYQEKKLKPYLKMAGQRIQLHINKKSVAVKYMKREVSKLLEDKKEEKARIKVEHMIRDDFTIEGYAILELMCDVCHERIKYITANDECPDDLREAICTLIWSAPKVDIPELDTVKSQFSSKYGSQFTQAAEGNIGGVVNERIVHKLSVQPPSAVLIVAYLKEIAKEYNVVWEPTEIGLPDDGMVMGTPSGFSIPMAPASEFRSVYQKQQTTPVLSESPLPPPPDYLASCGPGMYPSPPQPWSQNVVYVPYSQGQQNIVYVPCNPGQQNLMYAPTAPLPSNPVLFSAAVAPPPVTAVAVPFDTQGAIDRDARETQQSVGTFEKPIEGTVEGPIKEPETISLIEPRSTNTSDPSFDDLAARFAALRK